MKNLLHYSRTQAVKTFQDVTSCSNFFLYIYTSYVRFVCDSSSRISRADTHFPQKLPFDLYLTFILIHFNVYRRSLNLFGHPSFN